MTNAQVYECGDTVCGVCSLLRNHHCPVCGEYSSGPFVCNALEAMLQIFLVDYEKKVEQDLEECEKYESLKTYQQSARYAALETYVSDLLVSAHGIDSIVEDVVAKGFEVDEAQFALQNLFNNGYFALLSRTVIPKGSITTYIEECWDLLSTEEQLYLYILSTSAEKPNWYKILERMGSLERFSPDHAWVFQRATLDARPIDLETIPYDHTPVNEDYSYETQSEWSEPYGYTEDEFEEDPENYASESEPDTESESEWDTESVTDVVGENESDIYTDDTEELPSLDSEADSTEDESESDTESEIELVHPQVGPPRYQRIGAPQMPAQPAPFDLASMLRQVETMTKAWNTSPQLHRQDDPANN